MIEFPTDDPGSAIGLVDTLLRQAYDSRTSDIHLIPTRDGMNVLMRRDGTLFDHSVIPVAMAPKVVGRLKVLADLMVYRTDIPQEGRISIERSGIGAEVRVSSYPTLTGEKIAVRLDAQHVEAPSLESLGLPRETWSGLTQAIEQPEGLVLVTGPSGSGKTTTLYSCLHHLTQLSHRRSIVSVEDPIERRIEGVIQTEINEVVGLGYVEALRSLLRQDPDVILIGEIRDRDTASIALQAALTGHLVASTIHAGTAPQVFSRLMEMGVEPHAVTSVIRGVLAQRLLRRTCPVPVRDPGDHAHCSTCSGTGYSGRVLVSEWIPMSMPLREAILEHGDTRTLTAAAETAGYRSLREEANELVELGITTQQEVDRVLGIPHQKPARIAAPEARRSDDDRGPDPVPSDAGGDVSVEGPAAESDAPVIPRPATEQPARGSDGDGDGRRVGHEPGGGVRPAGGPDADPVPVLGESWDR